MTWVKVCGLRRREDVEAAVEAGADAVGFVLAASPRYVTVEEARTLGAGIQAERVLVTVDVTPGCLLEWVDRTGATAVQPHGRHAIPAGDAAAEQGLFVLHPVPVHQTVDLAGVPENRIPLLDAHTPARHGGTGTSFDWSLTNDVQRPFVLAGGLGPHNVADAIVAVRPWGVDASSGLESAPGVKDPQRIRAFVREAKTA